MPRLTWASKEESRKNSGALIVIKAVIMMLWAGVDIVVFQVRRLLAADYVGGPGWPHH